MIETAAHGEPSLRVRGTVAVGAWVVLAIGVIPACAGNSDWPDSKPLRTGGHPCVCGERHSMFDLLDYVRGSSLRVRGTGLVLECERVHVRVIPACAGNRLCEQLVRKRA